jgi:hypothetical protein
VRATTKEDAAAQAVSLVRGWLANAKLAADKLAA